LAKATLRQVLRSCANRSISCTATCQLWRTHGSSRLTFTGPVHLAVCQRRQPRGVLASVEKDAIADQTISACSTRLLVVPVQRFGHLPSKLSYRSHLICVDLRSDLQCGWSAYDARRQRWRDSRITYRTSPLSIPKPKAIVAHIQLKVSALLEHWKETRECTHLILPCLHSTCILSFFSSSIPAWYAPV
jgi:hypothetical protein